ncbi:MAG TPA: sulfotransferase [Rhizomicrobium sp.]
MAATGRHEEAVSAYETALSLGPDDPDIRINLGASLYAVKRHDEAVTQLQAALASKPQSPEAHNNLGNALVALGRKENAVAHYQEAIALRSGFAEAHNNLGRALIMLGQTEEAIAQYENAIAIKPGYVEAHDNLANALVSSDREREAVPHFAAALEGEPDRLETLNNFGCVLNRLYSRERAAEVLGRALALKPDFAAAQINLGVTLNGLERPLEAIALFEMVLKKEPDLPEACHGLGMSQQMMGRLAESRRNLERALELAPQSPAYHRAVVDAKRITPGDPQLAVMEDLARSMTAMGIEQQIELHFALGKAYADLAQHERSFEHYLQGNTLKRPRIDYDERATLDMFSHIEEVFSADLIRRTEGLGEPSTVPVFIVGMPRSGTTLTEQMLASHPAVHGAGELQWVHRAAQKFRGRDVRDFFPEAARTLSAEQLRELGGAYLADLRTRSATAQRITDKMPMNFRFVGLIHMMLPNAKIVHMCRNSLDTCLSCFTKNFTGDINYAYDLGELGRYWRAYDKIMTHWHTVLPERVILDVRYEDLVRDFEGQARRIVAHCGLEWDEACLQFYSRERPVRTASVIQVRQPIYGTSVGRWQPYQTWLGPLLAELPPP